ncbi:TPA: ParB N-terminal domain-containing protein [Clostridioides difficile]|nr:ParB N-terminal domain-containing protein [Clostridioides difficile]
MAKNFMMNSISKLEDIKTEIDKVEKKDEELFKVEYIHIDDIIPNVKNFYSIRDKEVEEVANSILENGLFHNLLVRKLENGKYELISGEKRYTAHKRLIEQGYKKYSLLPCQIKILNDVDAEIALIEANACTRPLTDAEKVTQAKRLIELYTEKKNNGEKINMRESISEKLNLKPTQAQRYMSIANKLITELVSLLDTGELSISSASEFATLSEENQKVLYQAIKEREDKLEITKQEANDLKNKYKELEEEKNIIEKKYQNKIEQLEKDNKEKECELKKATDNINEKIDKVKEEMKGKTKKELDEFLEEIESLEYERKALEDKYKEITEEHQKELEKIKEEQIEIVSKANADAKIKAENIIRNFEEEQKKIKEENKAIKLENERLKKELENKNIDESEKKAIYEVKTKLDTVRSDVIRITTLIKNIPLDEKMTKDFDVLKRLFDTLESTLKIHGK